MRRRRIHAVLVLLVGAGFGLAFAAGLLHWITQTYGTDHSGRLAQTGSTVAPSILPLLGVAAAGLIAALVVGGRWGRNIGVVVGLAGLGVIVAAVRVLAGPPTLAAATAPVPADLLDPVVVHPAGPVLALAAGALVGLAGIGLVLTPTAPRLRGRFERSSATDQSDRSDLSDRSDAGPDGWWKALDQGSDPTSGEPSDDRGGPGVRDRSTGQNEAATMTPTESREETSR